MWPKVDPNYLLPNGEPKLFPEYIPVKKYQATTPSQSETGYESDESSEETQFPYPTITASSSPLSLGGYRQRYKELLLKSMEK